jgi:hypothetical protein
MNIKNIFQQNKEESKTEMIESLFEKAVDYGKTSLRLVKLKTLSKTSDVASTSLSHLVVLIFAFAFMLFLSLGLAIWIGEILGQSYYGFFIVAAVYALIGIFIQLFLHNWLKKVLDNYLIDQVLK